MGPSAQDAARRGRVSEGMRLITARCARASQNCTSRIGVPFLFTFQEVTPISKTRNQLLFHMFLRCYKLREIERSTMWHRMAASLYQGLIGTSGHVQRCLLWWRPITTAIRFSRGLSEIIETFCLLFVAQGGRWYQRRWISEGTNSTHRKKCMAEHEEHQKVILEMDRLVIDDSAYNIIK